jgi:hypothetical protein
VFIITTRPDEVTTGHPNRTIRPFSRREKSSRRYTSQVDPAGEIDVCENLDIVHFRWLVREFRV